MSFQPVIPFLKILPNPKINKMPGQPLPSWVDVTCAFVIRAQLYLHLRIDLYMWYKYELYKVTLTKSKILD